MLELYTDRLKLRSLHESDWEHFYMLHRDPQINQYVRIPESEEVIRAKFQQRSDTWFYGSGEWLTLAIETLDTGMFVGLTGLYCQSMEDQRAEVGYLLAKEAHGKGYATESLQAVIDWACLSFDVHKFVAHCAQDNHASARVLEKCGFKLEGILRQEFKIGEQWFDDCAYGLLSTERQR
ncbi:GNAT family N-acetyltransferase [Shewanella sp. CG12_big_fil_rev_8_21_14_0_65_47_15]|uniref:GNAT family N-acetyltransferase n=1 Tax=Shewanella sp. CG12_big_fil_rev_8_21_14_0_65_47_15 TaxID=1975537 RepID=UPI000CB80035|nr:GNAT family N-acetyltransferase [Shewanella sp. CG12_big_fil_rev_8_21_14_0_65_47_15]PIW61202.1 MAG: N-acetyltransferase [Shewanella sp. CG12_big_fil_rev_8_21_14_0_65_47_15]